MKKFKFKLETVRMLRRLKKDQAMGELSKAIQRRVAQEDKIEKKQIEMKELNEEIISARRFNFSSAKQSQYLSQFNDLHLEKVHLVAELSECEAYEKEMRANLAEATKGEKVMDNLYEKKKKVYAGILFKQEEKELEDLMNARNERYNLEAI